MIAIAAEEQDAPALADIRERELFSVQLVQIGKREHEAALQAYAQFGKDRHPAALNMGDCCAYACTRINRAALVSGVPGHPNT